MTQELVVQSNMMSASEVVGQANLIQQIMKEAMKDGMHYMVIPGCGAKPSLLKPGAEKLSLTFRLRPIIDPERDIKIEKLEGDHINVVVYCHIINADGVELATGVGSASTKESKHRYRGGEKVGTGVAVPKEYWNLKKAGKIYEANALLGGDGFCAGKVDTGKQEKEWQICSFGAKAENPDLADTWNTVLKMGKKRAYVDGMLAATGASDIFTQDIEDMNLKHGSDGMAKDSTKPATKAPVPKAIESVQIKTNIITMGKATIKSKSGVESVVYRLTDKDGGVYTATDEGFVTLCKSAKEGGLEVLITHKTDAAKTVEMIDLVEPGGKEVEHGTGQPTA